MEGGRAVAVDKAGERPDSDHKQKNKGNGDGGKRGKHFTHVSRALKKRC